ncbi:MAG: hypothetical protein LBH13_00025 [Cellulomonadaceae bacterium]|nr:hypothetical protein [Cellulomonadaceae bacterium]
MTAVLDVDARRATRVTRCTVGAMDITYRPYRETDAPALMDVGLDAFAIASFSGSERLAAPCSAVYIRECLAGSTWAYVAVKDGATEEVGCYLYTGTQPGIDG